MPELDLDELERLHAAAAGTPYKAKGDWIYAQSVSHRRTFSRRPMAYTIDNRDGRYKPTETASYIVAACNAVPELMAIARYLAGRCADMDTMLGNEDAMTADEWLEVAKLVSKGSRK